MHFSYRIALLFITIHCQSNNGMQASWSSFINNLNVDIDLLQQQTKDIPSLVPLGTIVHNKLVHLRAKKDALDEYILFKDQEEIAISVLKALREKKHLVSTPSSASHRYPLRSKARKKTSRQKSNIVNLAESTDTFAILKKSAKKHTKKRTR